MIREHVPAARRATSVAAVVVAYFPTNEILRLIDCLVACLGRVLIVDNTPGLSPLLSSLARTDVTLIASGENLGVAGAYNLAVSLLVEQATHIKYLFLFDQDSTPDVACLWTLIDAMDQAKSELRVAQVGPAYFEKRRAFFPPLIHVGRFWVRRLAVQEAEPMQPVSYMISSGTLLSLEAAQAVGCFDESLFIDYVDVEYGLRCQRNGFVSLIATKATMEHSIGEAALRLGRWTLPSHSPIRRRYQVRNAILLLRRSDIPLAWKISELVRVVLRIIFALAASRMSYSVLSSWFLGLRDGVMGRGGKIDGSEP
ncbi:MAG: hypothetical protein RJA63_2182 [Pseudomonadota bacterium]